MNMQKVKNKSKQLHLFCRLIAISVLYLFTLQFNQPSLAEEDWNAPADAKNISNPISADESTIKEGKKLYLSACLPCHGKNGYGDGPAAKFLESHPRNLADSKRMNAQTDGELHWKILTGRTNMPSFKDALKEEDIWKVILYIRTLSK